ncbi:MAG: hypothetical protein JKX73_09310 [Flavobacteriales bacterium]|nr:hypothetical protein [Flavobacteriales bacterium]
MNNTLESAIRISLLVICTLIFWALLTNCAKAAGADSLAAPIDVKPMFKAHGKLRLSFKTFVKNIKPSYTRRARRVTIECLDLSDNSHTIYDSKNGIVTLEFKFDARYLVYISKKGYETKMLAFSTKGANPIEQYQFEFDLQLEKPKNATYDEFTPSIYIVYNRTHSLFLYKRFYNKSVSNR